MTDGTVAAATWSAVVVLVPELDPVVREYRDRLDRAAAWGVPAHVSVLYPFVPPAAIDEDVLSRLAAAIRSVPVFECRFATTAWFGRDVVWLAPEPPEPFRRLTEAVSREFPDHPPYGGAFADVVPHATLGELVLGSPAELQQAESAVRANLPVAACVEQAVLLAGTDAPGSWAVLDGFPLA